jgi:hypothetical protein
MNSITSTFNIIFGYFREMRGILGGGGGHSW